MARPFRFAVQATGAESGRAWRDWCRKAEDLGYSAVAVPDHFGDQWAPVVALTAAADATERLRLLTGVLDNDFRHPVVLAREAATLDLVSEGRLELGIGAGWLPTDYETSGIPFDRPGVRIDRLAEALEVMKALWTDGACTFSGRHYQVRGAQGAPTPYTLPHPPILIGGGGRRVLTLAARHADIVGFNTNLASGEVGVAAAAAASPERFLERVAWVREAAGERFDDLELHCQTFLCQILPNRRQMAEAAAPLFGLDPDEALEVPLVLAGTVEEVCDDLLRRREELGFTYWTVPGDVLDDFAPVVQRLAGK